MTSAARRVVCGTQQRRACRPRWRAAVAGRCAPVEQPPSAGATSTSIRTATVLGGALGVAPLQQWRRRLVAVARGRRAGRCCARSSQARRRTAAEHQVSALSRTVSAPRCPLRLRELRPTPPRRSRESRGILLILRATGARNAEQTAQKQCLHNTPPPNHHPNPLLPLTQPHPEPPPPPGSLWSWPRATRGRGAAA